MKKWKEINYFAIDDKTYWKLLFVGELVVQYIFNIIIDFMAPMASQSYRNHKLFDCKWKVI